MLAYVFWHWKHLAFNRASTSFDCASSTRHSHTHRPTDSPGRVSRANKAPWANDGNEAYEDWYIVTGSAALDPLNNAAITPASGAARRRRFSGAGGTPVFTVSVPGAHSARQRLHTGSPSPGTGHTSASDKLRPWMVGDVA
jgi:hypothetical protein